MISSGTTIPTGPISLGQFSLLVNQFQRPVLEVARVMLARVNGLSGATAKTLGQITRYWAFFNSNHDSTVAVRSNSMGEVKTFGREISHPTREIPHPTGEEFYLDEDAADPAIAYKHCRTSVRKLIMLLQKEMLTKDAAIQWVSKKYGLRTFVRKIWNGEHCEVKVWQWIRVHRALARAEKLDRLNDEHQKRVAREMKEYGL